MRSSNVGASPDALAGRLEAACAIEPTDEEFAEAASRYRYPASRARLAIALERIIRADGAVSAVEVRLLRRVVEATR